MNPRFAVPFVILATACNTTPRSGSRVLESVGETVPFLRDLDFELPASDQVTFWTFGAQRTDGGLPTPCLAQYAHALSTTEKTSGEQSLQLSYKGDGFCENSVMNAVSSLPAARLAGKKITVSGQIKLTSDIVAVLAVSASAPDGTRADGNNAETMDWSSRSWQKASFEFQVPANASSLQIVAVLVGQSASETALASPIDAQVYFDDLAITIDDTGEVLRGSSALADLFPDPAALNAAKGLAVTDVTQPSTVARIAQDLSQSEIVGLGEATHGTAEFQKQKVQVIKDLIANHGFRAVAFEDDMALARAIDSFVQGGTAPTTSLGLGFTYRWWKTADVYDLLTWMRTYNAQHPKDPVHFYGFDVESPQTTIQSLKVVFAPLEPTAGAEASALLTEFQTKWNATDWAAAKTVAEKISAWIDTHGGNAPTLKDPWAKQLAQLLVNAAARKIGSGEVRDRFMADSVDWIRTLKPQTKIALWAHDLHIAKIPTAMGDVLAQRHPGQYLALGFAFGRGSFLRYNFQTGVVEPTQFGPAPKSSVDGVLAALQLPSAYFSPAALAAPELKFLSSRPKRESGSEGSDYFYPSVEFPKHFDALVYFDVSTPIVIQN